MVRLHRYLLASTRCRHGLPVQGDVVTSLFALVLVVSALTAPTDATALEFTADRTTRVAQHVERTRVVYRDDMWRVEYNSLGPVQVTIVRKDRQLVWHLLPVVRQFKTVDFHRAYGLMVRPALEGELAREIIGTQMMDGHPTTLYEVTVRNPAGAADHFYQWVATDLNFPLKLSKKNGDWSMEYHHLKIGHMPDYFFQLPRAYRPLDGEDVSRSR